MMAAFGFLCFLFASCLFRLIDCNGGGTCKPLLFGTNRRNRKNELFMTAAAEKKNLLVQLQSSSTPSDGLIKAMTKNNVRRLSVSDGMEISGFTHDEVHRNLMLLSSITKGTI